MSGGQAVHDLESLLRDGAPRVLGAVMRRFGDFDAAEDAVQEALLAAHVTWSRDGVPTNPAGWLYRVACRRLADHVEGERARRRREARVAIQDSVTVSPEHDSLPMEKEDDGLSLLFLCCHPVLTTPSAIALTLRAVAGLTTAEIARAFLVPEPTMAQRITRAKRTLADAGVAFAPLAGHERSERLHAVRHVLYLLFNEGYQAGAGPRLQRVELADEAIRLTRLLHRQVPDDGEAAGLLALMLLSHARRHARTGDVGQLVPLHEQDRSRWDRAAIAEGSALIGATLGRGRIGPYQVQAAIAALHDEAASVETTDWPQVLALYEVLRRMADNPMVELGWIVAVAMVQGPQAALEHLATLAGDPRLQGSHRVDAVRAHLLERAGEHAQAIDAYRAAARRTASMPERDYLLLQAQRLSKR